MSQQMNCLKFTQTLKVLTGKFPVPRGLHCQEWPPYSCLAESFLFAKATLLTDEFHFSDESLLSSYLQTFKFSEIYLDNVFESGETAEIPVEIFRLCPAVRVLSLKNNFLQNVPAEVGRLAHLEKLYLTNNRLENWWKRVLNVLYSTHSVFLLRAPREKS